MNNDEELKNLIVNKAKEKLKNGEIKSYADVENFVDNLFQPLLQGLLDTELSNMLEYEKYEHKKEKKENSRNGYCTAKSVQTKLGIIKLKTPRDRNGEFQPIIIPKGENKLGKFEDIILTLAAKGMSYRDIENTLRDIYGVKISKDQIQAFINTISKTVEEWRNRKLKPFYPFIYADCLYVPIFDGIKSVKKAFYVIIGIDINGMKDVLGIWCDKTESASFWSSVFEDLKVRGVEDILYTTSDGIAGFKGSLESAFPKTQAQRCVVHLTRNLFQISPKKQAKEIVAGFKKIYSSPSLDAALLELENFKKEFASLPRVVEKVEDDMELITPLFELPSEIRRVIYTSNAVESVNSALRKVTNGKGCFSTESSVYKLFFLRIRDLKEKWKRPIKDWNKIELQLIQIFGERFTKYLDI